jgi:hypothetical protein
MVCSFTEFVRDPHGRDLSVRLDVRKGKRYLYQNLYPTFDSVADFQGLSTPIECSEPFPGCPQPESVSAWTACRVSQARTIVGHQQMEIIGIVARGDSYLSSG